MAKSPEEMAQAMIDNMPVKTGKSLPEWLKITHSSGLTKHGELMKLLKGQYGMSHGFANLVAHKTLKSDAGSAESESDLVAAQYAGPKAGLRPIYDRIIAIAKAFGKDLDIAPKKSYVSLRRQKQFAIVQPTTKTRVDLGINLKGLPPQGRLEDAGSFNSMVSHRVRLSSAGEVDDQVVAWLKEAFEKA